MINTEITCDSHSIEAEKSTASFLLQKWGDENV